MTIENKKQKTQRMFERNKLNTNNEDTWINELEHGWTGFDKDIYNVNRMNRS